MLSGRLLGNRGWVQLSEAEEPVDTHWTVTVVGGTEIVKGSGE